jgi:hypothetical protein
LKTEVRDFPFQDSPSCNCPELHPSNISKDGTKKFCPMAVVHDFIQQEDRVTGCLAFCFKNRGIEMSSMSNEN